MITYNGNDLSSLLTVLDIRRPLLAPQKLTTLSIQGRDGSFYFRKNNADYSVEVDIMIKGNTLTDVRNGARNLADLLYTDSPEKLIFSDEPDKYIMATLSDDSTFSDVAYTSKATLKFYCPDPFWYALTDDIQTWTSGGSKSFSRQGTAPSLPKIQIKGANSTGTISIAYNGSTMTFSGQLGSTDTLVIDSSNLTAYVIKSDLTTIPVMDQLDNLDFPVVNKGIVNIDFETSNGATISNITMNCNSRWR